VVAQTNFGCTSGIFTIIAVAPNSIVGVIGSSSIVAVTQFVKVHVPCESVTLDAQRGAERRCALWSASCSVAEAYVVVAIAGTPKVANLLVALGMYFRMCCYVVAWKSRSNRH
jgi:hypothetical protein